jgi:hypothetical protein
MLYTNESYDKQYGTEDETYLAISRKIRQSNKIINDCILYYSAWGGVVLKALRY